MTLTLDENRATYQVRAYQAGRVQINEEIYTESIIITPEKLIPHWPPRTVSELRAIDLTVIIELKPTIFIIGTGSKLQFPAVEIYGDLINHGIGVEIMDTRAACHTYNALSAENRNVVAGLIV